MYNYKKKVKQSFEEIIPLIRNELEKEGFGVLTEIDVKSTLKKKLNVDFDKYVILGACNPSFAFKALKEEQDIGLLLPCNIIIYEKESDVFVSVIKPTIAMSMINNDSLKIIAGTVEKKLVNVVDRL